MSNSESFLGRLVAKFPDLKETSRIAEERRIFVTIGLDQFMDAVCFIHDQLRFDHLATVTGLDEGENLAAMYHFGRFDRDGTLLNLKVVMPKEKHALPTITSMYHVSEYYERELGDLFGINVVGLPAGDRYPLPDNWPKGHYPLRKDWNAEMLKDAQQSSSSGE